MLSPGKSSDCWLFVMENLAEPNFKKHWVCAIGTTLSRHIYNQRSMPDCRQQQNFMSPTYTERQGQFLAYIHQYSIVNGCAPAEADMQRFFQDHAAERAFDGDIDERFYSSLESALDELAVLLRGEAQGIYPQFRDRLARVEQMTSGIGWGFHDFVGDVVEQLEEELGGRGLACGRFAVLP